MPLGAWRATGKAFRLHSKREKTNGLACDIDDVRRHFFGRDGRQNPTGGYDSGDADSTPVGGFYWRVYRPGLRIGHSGQYLPLAWIKRAAAVAFIIIGVLILVGKF
jgi:hypothetical protein